MRLNIVASRIWRSATTFLLRTMRYLKLRTYLLLSRPFPFAPRVRYFRFGLPYIMKCTNGLCTEADALRMLNQCAPNLPIPRLLDSISIHDRTYAIMTKIPGEMLCHVRRDLPEEQLRAIVDDILAVLHQLWELKQHPSDTGKVMLSASGDGVRSPAYHFESTAGPFDNILECYTHLAPHIANSPEELVSVEPDAVKAVVADRIVFVHCDLRSHNIIVKNGRLSGIIDWENSGWLPLHWQLHILRRPCFTMRGRLLKMFSDPKLYPVGSEAAYQGSCKLLYWAL